MPAQPLCVFVLLAALLPRTLEHLVAVGLGGLGLSLGRHSVSHVVTLVPVIPGTVPGALVVALAPRPLSLLVLVAIVRTTFPLPGILGRAGGRGEVELFAPPVVLPVLPLPLGFT